MEEKREMPIVPVSGRGRKEKLGKKFTGVLIVVLLLTVVVLGAAVYLLLERSKPKAEGGLACEANVIVGDTPGRSKEERQRELDSVVGEGTLVMSINAIPGGPGTGRDRSINWLIENPSNQGKLIRVEIYRDDAGEKIYETGVIKSGNYVESASPDTDLPVGEYDCTARFYTYRPETEECIGQAAARIRLVIYE